MRIGSIFNTNWRQPKIIFGTASVVGAINAIYHNTRKALASNEDFSLRGSLLGKDWSECIRSSLKRGANIKQLEICGNDEKIKIFSFHEIVHNEVHLMLTAQVIVYVETEKLHIRFMLTTEPDLDSFLGSLYGHFCVSNPFLDAPRLKICKLFDDKKNLLETLYFSQEFEQTFSLPRDILSKVASVEFVTGRNPINHLPETIQKVAQKIASKKD